LNTVLVGILVLGLAQLEYAALQRWEEVAEIILGVWLISSPYVFGYFDEGLLRIWHLTLGVLVVADHAGQEQSPDGSQSHCHVPQ
jgi:hypothetical protein